MQIERAQLVMIPAQPATLAHAFEKLILGHPLHLGGGREKVRAQRVDHLLPAGENLRCISIRCSAPFDRLADDVKVDLLDIERRLGGTVMHVDGDA